MNSRATQCHILLSLFALCLNAQKVHLCAELTAASCILEPIGDIGANFSLKLSSQTQFSKIKNKEAM